MGPRLVEFVHHSPARNAKSIFPTRSQCDAGIGSNHSLRSSSHSTPIGTKTSSQSTELHDWNDGLLWPLTNEAERRAFQRTFPRRMIAAVGLGSTAWMRMTHGWRSGSRSSSRPLNRRQFCTRGWKIDRRSGAPHRKCSRFERVSADSYELDGGFLFYGESGGDARDGIASRACAAGISCPRRESCTVCSVEQQCNRSKRLTPKMVTSGSSVPQKCFSSTS